MIEIWSPRWHDRKVLIARYKVHPGINQIKFTRSKCLKDKVYELDAKTIVKYNTESNGSILCFAVPLNIVLGELNFNFEEKHS